MWKRVSAGVAGGALLAGVAGAAFAEEQVGDDNSVDVSVSIEDTGEGTLAMSVAGTSTSLAEAESGDAAVRQFDGALPTVTVTDTRTAEEIPEGAFWYVLGSASSFVGDAGQPEITSDHLGWSPVLQNDDGSGNVATGGDVDTVMDEGDGTPNDNVGLAGQELLAMALTSESAIGSWEASADLTLKVPAETAPGAYSSTLTLSLFE